MDLDRIYTALGNPGRYHVGIFILLSLDYVTVVMNHLVMAIYGIQVNFQCTDYGNSTVTDTIIIKHKKYCELQKPTGLALLHQNFSVSMPNVTAASQCNKWQYAHVEGEKSLRTEVIFNLETFVSVFVYMLNAVFSSSTIMTT